MKFKVVELDRHEYRLEDLTSELNTCKEAVDWIKANIAKYIPNDPLSPGYYEELLIKPVFNSTEDKKCH